MTDDTFVSEPINNYAALFTNPESDVLRRLHLETEALIPGAQMLSGHLQGQFLKMMSRIMKPKCILEIGTYTGYSAICLAKGLDEEGLLHTVDNDDRWSKMRQKYWQEDGCLHKIKLHIGDAKDIIQQLDIAPELVFIDADKKGYIDYYEMCIGKMQPGGCIIADNVLFKGNVILPAEDQKGAAKYMHAFNKHVANDNRVEQVILPIRDGLSLIRIK